ncbi:MAG: DUF1566 domain-containing protein, partial [Pedobacter sp.]
VCSKDNIPGTKWFNGTAKDTFTTGDGAYAGKMNTLLQVALQGADAVGNFAAKACLDYSVTEGGVLYGDWYLPSKWELNEIYKVRSTINSVAATNGGAVIHAGFLYWSSTESDAGKAWLQNLSTTGTQGFDSKSYILEIRAVRSF